MFRPSILLRFLSFLLPPRLSVVGSTDFSYDFQNQVRDLEEELAVISASQPNFLSIIPISTTPVFNAPSKPRAL